MKVKIFWIICFCIGSIAHAQKTKVWKLDSYQFNLGGVMSTKIPAATYGIYYEFIASSLSDIPLFNNYYIWSEPKSLTNLRMRPICNMNVQLFNAKKSAIQRFGLSVNSRMLSSFLTHYEEMSATAGSIAMGDLRLDHRSPVLTLDYAYIKQYEVFKKLNFNFGVGAYVGVSMWNKISIDASRQYLYSNGTLGNGGSLTLSDFYYNNPSLSNFAKHNFNAGIYASFGLEYSLHDKQAENQRWFITYENRICYDFFAVKNVPSSWFSFQSANMFGLKYYLNRK